MNYQEILKLKQMLEDKGIPFEFFEWLDGYTIKYPNKEHCKCSVIQNFCSFGCSEDLLEIMGLTDDDDVLGYLTAEDVFNRIVKDYERN